MAKRGKYKYCPVCGARLEIKDTYCTKCGYSFAKRHKRQKKIKWRNLLFVIIILLVFYFSIRYFNGQSIIPTSFPDTLNFSWGKKG